MPHFPNIARAIEKNTLHFSDRVGAYLYDQPSPYLRVWSRFFQAIVSQTCTRMISGEFHTRDCGILKAEGGCTIHNVGELVLGSDCCYWDMMSCDASEEARNEWVKKCAAVITDLVVTFNPMNPKESMLKSATYMGNRHLRASPGILSFRQEDLEEAMTKARVGGPFGGDPLWAFWNRHSGGFSTREIWKDLRPYVRYVKTTFEGVTDADVDQEFADQDLAQELEDKLRDKARKHGQFLNGCSPKREGGELKFWVTHTSKWGLSGWVTREEIERFLAS